MGRLQKCFKKRSDEIIIATGWSLEGLNILEERERERTQKELLQESAQGMMRSNTGSGWLLKEELYLGDI